MNSSHVIELQSVEKRYGQSVVLSDINLQINPGENFVLVGHNGAGKTSLMKLMLGLTQPSAGQLKVLGIDPASGSFTNQRRSMGYLPESVSFYHTMTGLELLKYYAQLKGVPVSEVHQRLEQVGLQHAANQRLATYSKGMRQRLGLAQAILGKPRLLFLDEPTTGLDPSLRSDFYQIISDLCAGGTTVVISSHSLNEIEAQADRIALIRKGKLMACDKLASLSDQAGLPVRTRLSVAPGKAAEVASQLAGYMNIDQVDDHFVELACTNSEKVALLRQVADLGDSILDVSMASPRLDEIYLHFMAEDHV
jgi:Cu-processing system ATP-binding protein